MARRKTPNQLRAQFNRLVTNPALSDTRFGRVMIARNTYEGNMANYFNSRPRINRTGDFPVPRAAYMGLNQG